MYRGFLYLCLLVLFAACKSEDIVNFDNTTHIESVRINSSANVVSIRNYISKTKFKSGKTKGEDYLLIPYVVNNDTVMYVANYHNGGFEIFSNDNRLPMVLVKSNTGSFIPNSDDDKNLFSKYIGNIAEDLEKIGIENEAEPSGMWKTYGEFEDFAGEPGNEPDVYFLGYAYKIEKNLYSPAGGRLKTKWGQKEYFNQAVPYVHNYYNMHSLTGCGAVALGQYLYHYHKYFGFPTHTVSDAIYDPASNTYSFSGYSDTVWGMMDDGSDPSIRLNPSDMWPTAVFLGYIAKGIGANFGKNYMEPTEQTGEQCGDFLKNYYGLSYKYEPFNTTLACDILSSGHPVILVSDGTITSDGVKSEYGHIYLLDYAEYDTYIEYEVYSRDKSLWETGDDQPSPDIEEQTLEWYTSHYRDVYWEYGGFYEEMWVYMNWGEEGKNDNILINAALPEWIINHADYTLNINRTWILH